MCSSLGISNSNCHDRGPAHHTQGIQQGTSAFVTMQSGTGFSHHWSPQQSMNLLHFRFLPCPFTELGLWTHKKTLTLTEGTDHYSNTPINKKQDPKPPFKNFFILKLHINEAWFDRGYAMQFCWLNPTNPECVLGRAKNKNCILLVIFYNTLGKSNNLHKHSLVFTHSQCPKYQQVTDLPILPQSWITDLRIFI